jgi:hypothetical protein
MRLIQFVTSAGDRAVGAIDDEQRPRVVQGVASVRDLALEAHRNGRSLAETVEAHGLGDLVDYDALIAEKRLLVPLDHPEPSHVVLALTGLTHLGGASARNAMHAKLQGDDLTDSMKMFKMGIEGGKPAPDAIGVQPEWAYKGDGTWMVAPEQPLELPGYADDGGEEGEVAGLYVIGDDGTVLRVGFALANEYSDHVMERKNYLFLAHSKLRQCSFGPELLIGELPRKSKAPSASSARAATSGAANSSPEKPICATRSRIWSSTTSSMPASAVPGDVHVYFFGASGLSTAAGMSAQPGDVFEVASPVFGRPLRNPLVAGSADTLISVKPL